MSARRLVAATAAAVGLAAAVGAGASTTGSSAAEAGIVSWVVDGDTLHLRDGRKVRLLQVDSPEVGMGECFSRKARTQLLALAPVGSLVGLERDPALDATDRYGRILRYVWRGRSNVNLELVRRGAAAPWLYRGEAGRYAAALLAAARTAKAQRRGLWGACPATALDPFHAIETGGGAPGTAGGTAARPVVGGSCDPGYADRCVPPPPPDLDCADIRARGWAPVRVVGADAHRLDGDGDGWGCE